MKKRQFEFLLLVLIVSGFFMVVMSYNSFVSDKKIIDGFDKDVLKISLFNRYVNKFNYFHGLWLIPTGIFFIMFLVLLELPSFEVIYKKIKKDFREKFRIFFL